jgi:HK97 family phage major capsid protein
MGKIAELLEKKAEGSITDAELKELDQLLKEANLAAELKENGGGTPPPPATDPAPNEGDPEAEVDKLAQRFADSVTNKFSSFTEKMDQVMKTFEENQPQNIRVNDNKSTAIVFDQELGKKTVGELSTQKIVLPGRKEAGKSVTEVSARTFLMLKALFDNDRQKLQILSEGTAADGGYLVPEEFANMIIEDIRDVSIMRQIAAPPITINTDTFHLPNLASRPQAQWRAEKAVKATSTVQFGENVLTPYSLASIVPLTNELVADASLGVGGSIVNYVARLMAVALAEKEEQAFWIGNGSGKPSGIDGGVYSYRTIGAGSTDATRSGAIISAYHRTPQGYRSRGVYVANASTWERIGSLADTTGRFLLSDLAGSPTQTLRGRPIYESNWLAGGTMLYGDFGYYQIVDREGVSVRVSDEATVAGLSAFERNLTYVRVEKRVDAELTLPQAITKVTGLGSP